MNRKTILLILGLAGFTVMADNWVVSPILPTIAKDFGIPVTSAGLLITSYMIPFGLFQLVFGPLADRYGKRQVINFSLFIFTFATALCAIGFNLYELALYRALTGIFAASVIPVSLALIADLVPMEERQAAIGTFMGISFLGQGLSMAIGGSIAYFISWRGVFIAYAVLSAVVSLLLFSKGKEIPSAKNPNSRFFAPYAKLLGTGSSLRTYIVVFIEGILIVGAFSYLGGYIEETFHFNNLIIGLVMTAFGAAAIVGGKLSGKFAAKIGRKQVLLLGLILATIANILLANAYTSLGVVITGIAFLGLGFTFAHSSLLTNATEFAAQARGAAMSLVAFCFMGGGGLGTALGGKVIASIGYDAFFLYNGVALICLVFLAALMVKVTMPQGQGKPMQG